MKKSSSKRHTYGTNEVKRYLGALQEENRGNFKMLGERLDGINDKLDSHTEMIGGLSVRMTSVEMTLTLMQEDISFIKSGLKRKVDQDEFDALIRRVSVLERRVLK